MSQSVGLFEKAKSLSWHLLLAYATFFPVLAEAGAGNKKIVVSMTAAGGDEVSVRMSIDVRDSPPIHRKYIEKARPHVTWPCATWNAKTDCYLAPENLLENSNSLAASAYGLNLVFREPVPLAYRLASGGRETEIHSIVPRKRLEWIGALPRLADAMEFSEEQLSRSLANFDRYSIEQTSWTYEPISRFSDKNKIIAWFDRLTKSHSKSDCEEACAGFFKFTSKKYNGFAYCAYLRANGIASAPFSCAPMYFDGPSGSYVTSLVSPFNPDGGAGFDGLSCSIKEIRNENALANGQLIIADIASEGLIGIRFDVAETSAGEYRLAGKRAFEKSRVFGSMYEYTTSVLTVRRTSPSAMRFQGYIHVTLNRRKVSDRKSMIEPNDDEVATYQRRVKEELQEMLRVRFAAQVECNQLNI